ncbi:hypothetical protein [Domibacillus tundrae]|uniref:hypothetical protein n=1 Tax=Domibacillus tundrae TaxID=1587527 RepID=UPI0006181F3C|nr:hypothetical protein [Domibacillus tundrae]
MTSSGESLYNELRTMVGKELLVITKAAQLDLFGQVFRPIFSGTISEVHRGHITLSPVILKMINSPFFTFPVPLCIPFEQIASFSLEVPSDEVFPLS